MTIREWVYGERYNPEAPTVVKDMECNGAYVTSYYWAIRKENLRAWYICDTADEAESMRLLLEQRREELEAVERKYELLIAKEITNHG